MLNKQASRCFGWRAPLAFVLAATLGIVTFGGPSHAGATSAPTDSYSPVPPEPGTDIPTADVKFAMRPYADNTFYIIAMKKGWFKDVGINIVPPPYGLKVTDTDVIALLLNGQVEISSEYIPLLLPSYKSAKTLKCIAFTDNFLGMAILANPNLRLKSFKDYIAEGMPFEQAIRQALLPLQGKTLVGAPELSDRPFEDAAAKFAKVQWRLQVLGDSKSLVLAKAGREDFVNPEGAPIVYTLEQAGWTDLLDNGDLYKYGPAGRVLRKRYQNREYHTESRRSNSGSARADRHSINSNRSSRCVSGRKARLWRVGLGYKGERSDKPAESGHNSLS